MTVCVGFNELVPVIVVNEGTKEEYYGRIDAVLHGKDIRGLSGISTRIQPRHIAYENQLFRCLVVLSDAGRPVSCDEIQEMTEQSGSVVRHAASRREFDIVLFWALDRFSREGVLPTLQYLQHPDAYGVGWRSYTEQYLDSTGVFKDAVISIMATIAKQENIRRSERIVAGLQRARKKVHDWEGRELHTRRVSLF
jgi:DNA invertase Pin-like site-specific DNA recombinase